MTVCSPRRRQSEAGDCAGVHPEKHPLLIPHLQAGAGRVQDRHADGQPARHHASQGVAGARTAGSQARRFVALPVG